MAPNTIATIGLYIPTRKANTKRIKLKNNPIVLPPTTSLIAEEIITLKVEMGVCGDAVLNTIALTLPVNADTSQIKTPVFPDPCVEQMTNEES